MTNLSPRLTIASQTVVSSPLNGFQQGSIDVLLRTFRNGRIHLMESHQLRYSLRFALRWIGDYVF